MKPTNGKDIAEITPSFKEKNAVCISTSDFYAKYASILILSILEHISTKENCDIVVLSTDMSFENKRTIEEWSTNNIAIRVYDISKKVNHYKFYTWSHFTQNTYYRLSIPDLFKNFNRVLYLDSDTIVNDDITKLFSIDMASNCIAAAKDTHVMAYCNGLVPEQLKYNKTVLKLKHPENYYQMGVSLFEINNIKQNYNKNLLEIASKAQYRWLDQDVLNVEFHEKIAELPTKWNVMIMNKPPYIDEYYLPEPYRKDYYEARLAPSIIHFVGGVYYRQPFLPDMKSYFWKYAIKSPFFGDILVGTINLHKENIRNSQKLLFIVNHPFRFYIKKLEYKLKSHFNKKYKEKYRKIRTLIKDAKQLKKELSKID